MPERIMYVQLKTGYDTDRGPAWIARLRFTKSWRTAYFHDLVLRRVTGTANSNFDSNFYDIETGDEYWISGPKRDQSDTRYGSQKPLVEDDVQEDYAEFLRGSPLPGRERG